MLGSVRSMRHHFALGVFPFLSLVLACGSDPLQSPGGTAGIDTGGNETNQDLATTSTTGVDESDGVTNGGPGSEGLGSEGLGSGEVDSSGGGSGSGGSDPIVGFYELPPPDACHNQFFVSGCQTGNPGSACGGNCEPVNACFNEGKPPTPPGFICPRFMLFSDEMEQAAQDDAARYGWSTSGESPFTYAIVGHDLDPGAGSVDEGGTGNTCCQCYQLIPSANENQASTLPLPKPMIVQSFNTGASTTTFDVFMGAGGLGANDACTAAGNGPGQQYDSYPTDGQNFGGGISAVAQFGNGTPCKEQQGSVTPSTLSSPGCQNLIESRCNEISDDASPEITELTRRSCIQANQPESLYHQNIQVFAKRVACPEGLTRVTGCQLQDTAPPVDPAVLSAAQAASDGSYRAGYNTTTMQDCCKPTCAWTDNVEGRGHVTQGGFDSFYTCHEDGVPLTQ